MAEVRTDLVKNKVESGPVPRYRYCNNWVLFSRPNKTTVSDCSSRCSERNGKHHSWFLNTYNKTFQPRKGSKEVLWASIHLSRGCCYWLKLMENSFVISFRAFSSFFRISSIVMNRCHLKVSLVWGWVVRIKGNDGETKVANNLLKDKPVNKVSY